LNAVVLDGTGGGAALGWDGVARWRPVDGVLWMHLDYTSPEVRDWLATSSGLDPVVREALSDRDPRPRALAIGAALLVVVRGIKRVILPERNEKDMVDVPDQAKKEMEFFFVKKMDELLPLALTEMPEKYSKPQPTPPVTTTPPVTPAGSA